MAAIDKSDHTIAFNMGGTWVELGRVAAALGKDVGDVEDALDGLDVGWIGDDLSARAEKLLVEELADAIG